MNPSKIRNIIASKINRFGTNYTCNSKTIKAIVNKAQVSYDRPLPEFTLLAGYNASLTDGYLITKGENRFVPTKIDKPNMIGSDQYVRGYLRQANASVDIKTYVDPSNASKDEWGDPDGTEGTDWGFVKQKSAVWVNFERMEMRPINRVIGQIESSEYIVTIPWSVNASVTPAAEQRILDRTGRNWKVLDVDDKSNWLQSYVVRVVSDDR